MVKTTLDERIEVAKAKALKGEDRKNLIGRVSNAGQGLAVLAGLFAATFAALAVAPVVPAAIGGYAIIAAAAGATGIATGVPISKAVAMLAEPRYEKALQQQREGNHEMIALNEQKAELDQQREQDHSAAIEAHQEREKEREQQITARLRKETQNERKAAIGKSADRSLVEPPVRGGWARI